MYKALLNVFFFFLYFYPKFARNKIKSPSVLWRISSSVIKLTYCFSQCYKSISPVELVKNGLRFTNIVNC